MTAPHPILDLPMDPQNNDAGASSVRQYLIDLLLLLVEYDEDIIKRPFGNSGWTYELYAPLASAGLIDAGDYDEEMGYTRRPDFAAGRKLLLEAIKSM